MKSMEKGKNHLWSSNQLFRTYATSSHTSPTHPSAPIFVFSFYDFRSWQSSKRRGTRLQSSIVIVCTSLLYMPRSYSLFPFCSINSSFLAFDSWKTHLFGKIGRTQSFWKMDGQRRSKEQDRFGSSKVEQREKSRLKSEWKIFISVPEFLNKRKYTFSKNFIGFRNNRNNEYQMFSSFFTRVNNSNRANCM